MVAKVISGKTIRGVLNYNENKVTEGMAFCISANNFFAEVDRLKFNDKLNTFLYHTSKNPKCKTNALHISLNFDPSDKVDDSTLVQISESYLQKIGFDGQPSLIYRHFDAAHPHIHIVTTNIKVDGGRIDLHNIGRGRSEVARKAIEVEFNLVKAQGRRYADPLLKPVDLTRACYGKSETKKSISNIVNTVTRSYRFTSIHELNAVLKQYNVVADRGKEGTLINTKGGLLYSLLDKKGRPVGVPIKASSIYGRPTLKNLEKQFELNGLLRQHQKDRLMLAIEGSLKDARSSFDGFMRSLVKQNIYPVIRQNDDGRIYGLTFVDNETKCVFNGSDLGRQYSAKGIMERLGERPKDGPLSIPSFVADGQIDHPSHVKKSNSALNDLINDLTAAEMDYSAAPSQLRRRKKRKRTSL